MRPSQKKVGACVSNSSRLLQAVVIVSQPRGAPALGLMSMDGSKGGGVALEIIEIAGTEA
jgi:hypothetical protein